MELKGPVDIQDHGGTNEIRYGGRTVKVTCYINTQEDHNAIAIRIGQFVKNTGDTPMIVTAADVINPEMFREIWNEIITAANTARERVSGTTKESSDVHTSVGAAPVEIKTPTKE